MAQLKRNCSTCKNYVSEICTRRLDTEKAKSKLCEGFGKKLPKKKVIVIKQKVKELNINKFKDYKPCVGSKCSVVNNCKRMNLIGHSCFNPKKLKQCKMCFTMKHISVGLNVCAGCVERLKKNGKT